MLKIEPEESIQDFIKKISKKENLFSRNRRSGRLSALPSRPNASGVEKEREERCIDPEGQPLMDVSNQQSKDESISLDDAKNSSSSKNVQKSALLREFHERRRSKLSSMSSVNPRMNVATPSFNKPILLSSRKRTPLLSSRKKESSFRSPFDNVKLDHQKGSVNRSVKISPSPRRGFFNSSSFKKDTNHSPYFKNDQKGLTVRPVRTGSMQCRGLLNSGPLLTGSSRKRTEDGDRNLPQFPSRNQSDKNSSTFLNINKDQDCCRALMFPEAKEEEEKEAETTKPLPVIELSNIKTSGSMLNRRSIISTRSSKLDMQHEAPVKLREDRLKTITEVSNERTKTANIMKHVNLRRRHSQLPTPTKSPRKNDFSQKRRSMVIPSCRQTILVNSSLLGLQDYTSPSKISVKKVKRKSLIPLYAEGTSNESSSFPESKAHPSSPRPPSITVTPVSANSGNSSFTANEALMRKEVSLNKGSVERMKDAATNTSPDVKSFQEMENLIKKILGDQKRIEESFESMTLEYFEKGKNLLIEYKKNASEGIRQLKEMFHEETSRQNTVAESEKECSRCRSNMTNMASEYESKSTKKEYKFLGTPMPKKNKKNLIRSFSDPPSPCDRSPSTRETSFHSLNSVVSPFTNIVGDCDRPSLMPMTPRMRHNVTGLKTSLNEQLEILFQ